MSEHTKEPWIQGDCSRNMIYAWKGQILVFTDDGYRIIVSCNQNYPEEAEANARRIVACVNACTGMKDPAADIVTLKAQHDGMLAALQMALADHMTEAYLHPLRDGTVEAIRCAIASAEKPPCA